MGHVTAEIAGRHFLIGGGKTRGSYFHTPNAQKVFIAAAAQIDDHQMLSFFVERGS